LHRQNFTTFSSTAVTLWKAGGIRRMFSGVMWRTVNVTATVYVANECRVHLSKYVSGFNI
jgi:hypothetical protein